MRSRVFIYSFLLFASGALYYSQSTYRKYLLTDQIYQELQHSEWSIRKLRAKQIFRNSGSGDHKIFYFVDVRRVSIPLNEAIAYYKKESERLGFRGCHVDEFPEAQRKFQWEWNKMGLDIPPDDNIVVISQNFTSDSTIRRHHPNDQTGK